MIKYRLVSIVFMMYETKNKVRYSQLFCKTNEYHLLFVRIVNKNSL